ncbi:MAG: hypothetical protein KDJ47_14175 [Hyphomicrobiaceae bacterium]|nr:hypothetical protein [Hyphomicrobiaceae bacterium]
MAGHGDSRQGEVPEVAGEEARRRQRMRSWAIAGILFFLVVVFYAATIVRLGGNVMNRPL